MHDFHIMYGAKYAYIYDITMNKIYKTSHYKADALAKKYTAFDCYKGFDDCIQKDGTEKKLTHLCWWDTKKISKITFNVTTRCNLRCKYCYAGYGKYDANPLMDMQSDIAISMLDDLLSYGIYQVDTVQFFGGEPLLAIGIIDRICSFFKDAFSTGKIIKIPLFTIITNGTINSDKVEKLIKKNGIRITLSVDWPQSVHDQQRVDKYGKGTYNLVINNFNKLKDYIDEIEVTFSRIHESQGYIPDTLIQMIAADLGLKIEQIYVSPVAGHSQMKPLSWHTNPNNITSEDRFLLSAFQENMQSDLFCNTGYSSMCLLPNGDLYPCHMYATNHRYCLGNVREAYWVEQYPKILKSLDLPNKYNNVACNTCWAKKICHLCPAKVGLTGENPFSYTKCQSRKELIERKLIRILADS